MMKKAKGTGLTQTEKQELRQRWDAFWSEVVINVGYLPLTIHWCAITISVAQYTNSPFASLQVIGTRVI